MTKFLSAVVMLGALCAVVGCGEPATKKVDTTKKVETKTTEDPAHGATTEKTEKVETKTTEHTDAPKKD